MKLYIEEDTDYLFEMANVRGITVKVPKQLDFSFSFTTKDSRESKDINHSFRVKPVFNPTKINHEDLGVLQMFGDWEYTPGPNDTGVRGKPIREMKKFFKTYKVLFAAVWEKVLQQDVLQDYFKGNADFDSMIKEMDFYTEYKDALDNIHSVKDFEKFVKANKIFNTYDGD